jgi:diaminohydroxyphosphoribosylaminopyrimidine deaminase/5-amino-6-(5-phosphoribosylamino)uracil reductase
MGDPKRELGAGLGATAVTREDRAHLRRALELAEGGRGRVSPNPLVGALVIRDGEREPIGEGFHAKLGGAHAERAALDDCRRRGEDPAGATLYVTLEPCAHHGRQPPCTEAILEAGISRVVYASEDPTEKASGRGPGILRDEGVAVELADGAEAAQARRLNQAFRKHARTGRPLVVFKVAMSLDGRVAATGGEPRWISGERSRALVHRWRGELDAVCVGIGTALADDPLLTARTEGVARQPRRVVFDSDARLPLDSHLVRSAGDAPLILVTASSAPSERVAALERAGAEAIFVSGAAPADRVRAGLDELGRREVQSLLLEGGPGLAGSFFDAGEVDEARLFIAPLLLGGADAPPAIGGGSEDAGGVTDALRPLATATEIVGEDLLIRARLREW